MPRRNLRRSGKLKRWLWRLAQLDDDGKFILVYGTFPTLEVAEAIGSSLVEQGLAACVNILPGLISIYIWQGARQREQEAAMIIKTRAGLGESVIAEVRRLHPYSNPALVVLPVKAGSADFLAWIATQTTVRETGAGVAAHEEQ